MRFLDLLDGIETVLVQRLKCLDEALRINQPFVYSGINQKS